jgi:hypothetical protein
MFATGPGPSATGHEKTQVVSIFDALVVVTPLVFLSISLFFCRFNGNRQDKYNFSVGRLLTDRNF